MVCRSFIRPGWQRQVQFHLRRFKGSCPLSRKNRPSHDQRFDIDWPQHPKRDAIQLNHSSCSSEPPSSHQLREMLICMTWHGRLQGYPNPFNPNDMVCIDIATTKLLIRQRLAVLYDNVWSIVWSDSNVRYLRRFTRAHRWVWNPIVLRHSRLQLHWTYFERGHASWSWPCYAFAYLIPNLPVQKEFTFVLRLGGSL